MLGQGGFSLMSNRVVTGCLAAVAVLLAAVAMLAMGPIAAEAKTEVALFKAKIKGTQINNWKANYGGGGKCEPAFAGKGREVIRFRSAGWTQISVTMFENARLGAFGKKDWTALFYARKRFDPPAFRLKGTVTRSGHLKGGGSPPECAVAVGDGTWTPPKRDCGRKPIKNRSLLAKVDSSTGWLSLENVRTLYPSYGDYKNCKVFGWAWPTFMVHDDKHRTAGVSLDVKRTLRNKKLKNLIFIGRGKSRHTMQGIGGNTRIEWSMTLKRVR